MTGACPVPANRRQGYISVARVRLEWMGAFTSHRMLIAPLPNLQVFHCTRCGLW